MTKTNYHFETTKNMVYLYGYVPMLHALKYFELREQYEVCDQIRKTLFEMYNERHREIPLSIEDFNEEDYLQHFWRIGLSGESALRNIPHYAQQVIQTIELTTKTNNDETEKT